jgi:hypothetical protein
MGRPLSARGVTTQPADRKELTRETISAQFVLLAASKPLASSSSLTRAACARSFPHTQKGLPNACDAWMAEAPE